MKVADKLTIILENTLDPRKSAKLTFNYLDNY